MTTPSPKAYPLATPELETTLLRTIQNASRRGLVKKGANEATKALNKLKAELVVMAADAEPLEIILHLPLVCEDKNTPYVFVSSKQSLGRACNVTRPVVALAIINTEQAGDIDDEVQRLKVAVEQLPM